MSTGVSKRIRSRFVAGCIATLVLPATALGALETGNFVPVTKTAAKRPATATRPAAPTQLRSAAEVSVVTGLAGEAGYVHYFVITGPDGEPETQLGIELEDGRMVWSFPEAGVFLAPFLAAGSFTIGNIRYEVEHLYGLRPLRDNASMRTLARELPTRIAPYVEERTPYCDENGSADRFCLSCLGFVLRVSTRAIHGATQPCLPTSDCAQGRLLYRGPAALPHGCSCRRDTATRARRIEALAVPEPLREELMRISAGIEQIAPTVRAPSKANDTAENACSGAAGGYASSGRGPAFVGRAKPEEQLRHSPCIIDSAPRLFLRPRGFPMFTRTSLIAVAVMLAMPAFAQTSGAPAGGVSGATRSVSGRHRPRSERRHRVGHYTSDDRRRASSHGSTPSITTPAPVSSTPSTIGSPPAPR